MEGRKFSIASGHMQIGCMESLHQHSGMDLDDLQ